MIKSKKAYKQATKEEKEIAKYAKKGYAEDLYDSNTSIVGKIYDRYTGANKISAELEYAKSSDKANRERAEAYVNQKIKEKADKQTYEDTINQYKKEINNGASFVGKIYNKLTDADKYQAELRYAEEKRKDKV